MMRTSERAAACPQAANHTPAPTDYHAWHAWADTMVHTHDQERCPGCGLWLIWTPRAAEEPTP